MTLAICGRETLGTLREWTIECFAAVPNRALPLAPATVAAAATPPFAPRVDGGVLGTRSDVVPVMQLRLLTVCWQLPAARPHWRSKPLA